MATRDYTLGKGKVLFKPEGDDAYIDLGNAPAFAVNLSIDKLEHFSSREGLSTKDLEVITKLGVAGSFTLDEPNAENLRMFVMATDAVATTQAAGTAGAFDSIADVVGGRWYPIYKSAARITNITVCEITGSVAGTDYTLDAAAGLIYVIPGGNLDQTPATDITFAATCNYGAATTTATDGGTLTSLKGDLYFVGNPPVGRIIDVQGFCALTPNGDFGLIGTDWMQMQFNVEFLTVTGIDGLIHLTDRGKA